MSERLGDVRDFLQAKDRVYGLAHNVCLNGKEQRALLSKLQDMELDMIQNRENNETIIVTLLDVIMDCFRYNEWPKLEKVNN